MPDTRIVNPEEQLARLKPGERLVLTFRPKGFPGLNGLWGLAHQKGQLGLPPRALKILVEVRATRVWTSEAQRTFRVQPTDRFDAAEFIRLVWPSLERAAISRKGGRRPMRRSTPVLRTRRRKPNRRSPN